MSTQPRPAGTDFIRAIVAHDLETGKHTRIVTRWPPEPNGYLHIGHAKPICLNFGIAAETGGRCHYRFDDTNPSQEEQEFVDAQLFDVRWLGFDWGEHLYFASDYFEKLYAWAERLIELGKAYVCDLSPDQVREYRGTLTEPGRPSPWRERGPAESLDLLRRMRAGEFPDGARTLRAKIEMASPNINLRDPVLYRIQHAAHHRTGDAWCIYPMYDYAHPLSDSIEAVTHSLCTIEYEIHRPLYDWVCETLGVYHPRQIEFAPLVLGFTVLSKRKLRQLVAEGLVDGWDDPRMPTLAGLRRRGYTPESIRDFISRVGVAKNESRVDPALLEHCVREDLNARAPRVMAVLDPLRVVIESYPEGRVEEFDCVNNPEDPGAGTRKVPFSRVLYIEREDFRETPPRKFHRLSPGAEVRLRYAYLIRCTQVVKDARGQVVEVRCTHDPATRGGDAPDGRKVRGTLHWVSAAHALPAEVRLYDRLFVLEDPDQGEDFRSALNPASLETLPQCLVEPSLRERAPGTQVQFERLGYFVADLRDFRPERLVFNRIASLRDTWSKIEQRESAASG